MPVDSPTPTIVVFERQPFCEPELKRQFSDGAAVVRSCRTIGDLDRLTLTNAAILAVVNLEDAPADLLRWLSRRLATGRQLPTIAVTGATTTSLRWHALEAGATAVVNRDVGGRQLARLCRKQWTPAGTSFSL